MRDDRRRRGWDQSTADADFADSVRRLRAEARPPSFLRNLLVGVLTVLVVALIVAVCSMLFRPSDESRPDELPAHSDSSIPGKIAFPSIHNTPETTCAYRRQCTASEFATEVYLLQKQWALTPEWLRAKCVRSSTLPSLTDCILQQTVTLLGDNPKAKMPWMSLDVIAPGAPQTPQEGPAAVDGNVSATSPAEANTQSCDEATQLLGHYSEDLLRRWDVAVPSHDLDSLLDVATEADTTIRAWVATASDPSSCAKTAQSILTVYRPTRNDNMSFKRLSEVLLMVKMVANFKPQFEALVAKRPQR